MTIIQFRKHMLQAGVAVPALAAMGLGLATPALGQEPTEEVEAPPAATIIVTGTRISRPQLESNIPITSIAGEQFFDQANINIGDTLNELPQLRSTFGQTNPGLGVGIAGLNLLDLRGLGTLRTLVLVNGRRHVAADILNNAVSPDINTIPTDLIQRVDIVTGANSAVYGSDAIAGVVNFVLLRDYEGLQMRGQAGVAEEGYGANQYISLLAGHNFADDRGNITLHGEYSHTERIYASDISRYRQVDDLGVVDVDPAGLANGSDGFPDRVFIRDIRSASINRFGLVPITQAGSLISTSVARCGTGIGQTNGAPSPVGVTPSTNGTPYNCTYIFTPEGNLMPQTGSRYGSGIIGGVAGGNGQSGRESTLFSILPQQERYGFNVLASFSVAEAFEPFVEAKWVRVNALGSNASPSFIQGTFTQYDVRERIRLDNPFLTPGDRATIASQILASGCNTSLTAACAVPGIGSPTGGPGGTPTGSFATTSFGGQGVGGPLTTADIAAINAGTYRFVLARTLLDSGIRDEEFQRDTFRIVGGVRGNFFDDWDYELAVNYGKFEEDTVTYGYLDRQRFVLALDAGRNPITGQIQCRSQFDPTAAVAFPNNPANQARLAADIAACVPYNPFGQADNSASANYFVYNARHQASLEQFDILGFVNGDLSDLFELPGGPISFSLGGEYRRERARYENDDFVESGATNAVVIGEFDPPTFEVKEAFGEVYIPILTDTPFFEELSLTGAGRVSDYNSAVGTVWTYNFGGEYAPIPDVRFRANYGKAVRAPNVSETGFPQVPNFAPGFLDPCAAGQIANNPNRSANCAADLGPLLSGLPNVAYSLPIIGGSNPDLIEESSKSLTIGAVVQPSFVPGLALSVDYYRIEVEDVIVSLTAQTIANNCYDQPSLNNQFCALFTRWRGPGSGPNAELPGEILDNSLVSAGVNFAKRTRRGIDVTLGYRTRFNEDLALDTQLIYVHTIQSSNFENPALPNFENRILGELGDPEDEFRWDTDLSIGDMTLGYRMQYIGPMWVNLYENWNPLTAACTTAGCPPNNSDYADIRKYKDIFYHDVRFAYDVEDTLGIGEEAQFYLGVDNLLDTSPPLGQTGTGERAASGGNGSNIYRFRGRSWYAGFRVRY